MNMPTAPNNRLTREWHNRTSPAGAHGVSTGKELRTHWPHPHQDARRARGARRLPTAHATTQAPRQHACVCLNASHTHTLTALGRSVRPASRTGPAQARATGTEINQQTSKPRQNRISPRAGATVPSATGKGNKQSKSTPVPNCASHGKEGPLS